MKKYRIFHFIIPLFIYLGVISSSFSETITIKGIDYSGYPTIKAEFVVKDPNGIDIRTPVLGPVSVTENGKVRNGTVYCAEPGKTKFSIVFVFDVSNSMNIVDDPATQLSRITILRRAAHTAIKALPDSTRWECAMTTFNNWGEFVQEFTNDRHTLDSVINSTALDPRGGTDYNAGFLYDIRVPARPGGLLVAREAKYKPVIIFMTDGVHAGQASPPPSRTEVWEKKIIDEANDISNKKSGVSATIYALTLGFKMPQSLINIVKGTIPTQGETFETNPNEDELSQMFRDLVDKVGTLGSIPPCEITWKTDCNGGGDVILSVPSLGNIADTMNYTIPDAIKPQLFISPNKTSFPNTKANTSVEKQVSITALKNTVTITGIKVTPADTKYSISDWDGTAPPFSLKQNQTRNIKVKYLTPNLDYSKVTFEFLSDACVTDSIDAHGGWVVADTFDCGSQKINETKDVQKVTFCNRTGDIMLIKTVQIKGGNKADFVLVSPTGGVWLPHDSCLTMFIKFTPSALGLRASTYEVVDGNDITYSAAVVGNGSGNPEISSIKSVTLPNASCITPSKTLDIEITNSGAKDLVIATAPITGTDASDFSLVTNVTGMTIAPGLKKTITVKFQPLGYAGQKNATLTINSNAGTDPAFPIQLTAKKDSVGFKLSDVKADFGIICPNEVQFVTLSIENTGDIGFTVNADEPAPFTLPVKTWNLTTNPQPIAFPINLKSATEGTFSQDITFTDECGNKFVVKATGKVEKPTINKVKVDLKTTVGKAIDTTFKLCNTSSRAITINQAQIPGTSGFTIVSPAIPPDWVIQPGNCMDVTVRFLPTTSNIINTTISLTGSPCSFTDSVSLYGNPALATADLAIDNTQGYVGQPIPVPINLRNPFKVTESGATSFNTTLSYDKDVLKYVSTSPQVTVNDQPGVLTINGAPLSGIAGVMITVNFEALPTPKTSSPLTLSGSQSVGGSVVFKEIPGIFTLLTATASIKIGEASAIAGQHVELPIYLNDVNNITAFNQGINTEISFDATLLEPSDNAITDLGIANGIHTIKYSNLSVNPGADKIIGRANFRAMLGSAQSTPVRLGNTTVTVGKANFVEVPGSFALKEICQTPNGPRLFSPTGIAAILQITPNPSDGNLTVVYETIEAGNTRLWISDILGTSTVELLNGESSEGIHEAKLSLNKLSSGRYVVIMQTPTARFSKWIDIMK